MNADIKQKNKVKRYKGQKTNLGFLKRHKYLHILFWPIVIFLALILLLYIKLLFSPVSLQIFEKQLNEAALRSLPPSYEVKLEEVYLTLENRVLPIVQFSPVTLYDKTTRAKIEMEAILVDFSLFKFIFGKPKVNITLVAPQIKIIQDLHGPRLGEFEFIQDESGKNPAIWVLEGSDSFQNINITPKGLDVSGNLPKDSQYEVRSDNDLMVANFLAMNEALIQFEKLVTSGKVSSLKIKNGNIALHDSVYGFFRQFKNIELNVALDTKKGNVFGSFSTKVANRLVKGEFERKKEEKGQSRLIANLTNIDFASFLSFLDDPKSLVALKGAGEINIDVSFNDEKAQINSGKFYANPVNSEVRIKDIFYPLEAQKIQIEWSPSEAKLSLKETYVKIEESFAHVSGEFFLGFDKNFGPTVSISIKANNLHINPNDLKKTTSAFDEISFSGWAAPLYGAVGIEQIIIQKEDAILLWAEGRADVLRQGMGLDIQVKGQGVNVDDLKRLWPYFIAKEARDWFVLNAKKGVVENLDMRFNFPVGTMPEDDENLIIPKGAINIDISGKGAEFIPWEGLNLIKANDIININVRDYITTATIRSAQIDTKNGNVNLENSAVIIDGSDNEKMVFEISGDITSKLRAIVDIAKIIIPDELKLLDLPINIDDLSGDVNSSAVFTISAPKNTKDSKIDYAANGRISDFASSEKIGGYNFDNGEFAFSLSQLGYNLNGKAQIAGFNADVNIEGILNENQKTQISTELNIKQIKEFGIDLTQFLNGSIKFVVEPLKGGTLKLFADLKNISINVADLGLKKAKGKNGKLEAIIEQENDILKISSLALAFGDVKIKGNMIVNKETGFQSASFPIFALSTNDVASLSAKPIKNGLSIKIRGNRMDLKSMLERSFSLEQPSTSGVKSSQYQKILLLDIELKQAIGFYGVVGHNFDLLMQLKGRDLTKVSLQTQFSKNNAVSIATNPTQSGRTMSVAFDDGGTLLRFLNIYSRLLGGKGSVVFAKNTNSKTDNGEIFMSDFALVDENKVAQIIGTDRDSRKLIANENRINFKFGKASFVRKRGSIEIIDGVIDGGEVGGTLSGFIHTTANEYDLIGTYIPLFGLNSIFQKIPLFGVILGGKEGEGLIGVTFAVRGKLNDPQFIINPVSILAPGMFRSLFEFRAREKPATQ